METQWRANPAPVLPSQGSRPGGGRKTTIRRSSKARWNYSRDTCYQEEGLWPTVVQYLLHQPLKRHYLIETSQWHFHLMCSSRLRVSMKCSNYHRQLWEKGSFEHRNMHRYCRQHGLCCLLIPAFLIPAPYLSSKARSAHRGLRANPWGCHLPLPDWSQSPCPS